MRVRAQLKIEVNADKSRWITCWHKRILLTSSRNFCRSRLALESLRTLRTQFENGILHLSPASFNFIEILYRGTQKLNKDSMKRVLVKHHTDTWEFEWDLLGKRLKLQRRTRAVAFSNISLAIRCVPREWTMTTRRLIFSWFVGVSLFDI